MIRQLVTSLFAAVLLSFFSTTANAIVVINLFEDGSDLALEASGSLDITGLVFQTSAGFTDATIVQPNQPEVLFLGTGDLYTGLTPTFTFGTGSVTFELGTVIGDIFGFEGPKLVVPTGYASGDQISSSGRISGQSLVSIGAIVGIYNLVLPSSDRIVLNVGQAPTSVPLPAALPLFAGGLGVLGFLGWRRKCAAA